MSIKRVFLLLSLLILTAMACMGGLLWYETGSIAELGNDLTLSKKLTNDMLILRRHEKDFY